MAKNKGYRFGFVSTLHTFGRALNFIPHLLVYNTCETNIV